MSNPDPASQPQPLAPPAAARVRTMLGDPRWLGPLFAVALVATVVVVARPWQEEGAGFGPIPQVAPETEAAANLETAPAIGNLAPNFRLQTLDGGQLRLADLRGQPVFLNFWATWCIFCTTEMPAMQRLADDHAGEIAVVGINVREAPERARAFATEAGIRYPLLLDADGEVTKAYQARQMPTSLVLDADGVVRAVKYGPLTRTEMEAFLQPLLAAP